PADGAVPAAPAGEAVEPRGLRRVALRLEPRVIDRDSLHPLLVEPGEDRVDLLLQVGLEERVVDLLDGADPGADPPQFLRPFAAVRDDPRLAKVVAFEELLTVGHEPAIEHVAAGALA
ncbi:MAG: hypothetical protein ACK559_03420, partial [bacterium]